MRKTYLQRTLSQLRRFGAQGLPTVAEVLASPDGTRWEGPASVRSNTAHPEAARSWIMTRNNPESYNFQTDIHHYSDLVPSRIKRTRKILPKNYRLAA